MLYVKQKQQYELNGYIYDYGDKHAHEKLSSPIIVNFATTAQFVCAKYFIVFTV